jgi:hypothetical protein
MNVKTRLQNTYLILKSSIYGKGKRYEFITVKRKNGTTFQRKQLVGSKSEPEVARAVQEVSSKSTAIDRVKLAVPIEDWLKSGKFDNCKTILDFGAGRGGNAKFLQERLGSDSKVTAYEPHPHGDSNDIISDYSKLDSNYDCLISTYVLNVVPKDIQDNIVKDMKKKSKKILMYL